MVLSGMSGGGGVVLPPLDIGPSLAVLPALDITAPPFKTPKFPITEDEGFGGDVGMSTSLSILSMFMCRDSRRAMLLSLPVCPFIAIW